MRQVLLFSISILFACNSEEQANEVKPSLMGAWDAYYGIYDDGPVDGLQYAVLLNYEHGFEISEDGIYHSRYAKGFTLAEGLETVSNSGTWELQSDTLSFIRTNLDGVTESLHFLVLALDKGELKIKLIAQGHDFQSVMQRTYYLRRAKQLQ